MDHCKPFDREDYTIERTALAKDLSKLFMSEKYSDIELLLGDDSKIHAHKIMLIAQSKSFKKMLNEDMSITELKLEMRYPKDIYIEFFRFLYNNTIKDLKKNLDALISLAIEFEVEGLKSLCHLEVISIITDEFNKLTKCTRPIPNHILMDFEKTQKFRQMLSDMKMFMKKTSSVSTSKVAIFIEEVKEAVAEAEVQEIQAEELEIETIAIKIDEIKEVEQEMDDAEEEEYTVDVIIEEEILTESMTNLIAATLSENEEIPITDVQSEQDGNESEPDAFESCYEEETAEKAQQDDLIEIQASVVTMELIPEADELPKEAQSAETKL